MSDPEPDTCGTTAYFPQEPYVGIADLCGPCKKLDIHEAVLAVVADPDAEPPVEAVDAIPAGDDNALFLRNCLFASRRVFIATGGKFPGCLTTTWQPCRSDFRWFNPLTAMLEFPCGCPCDSCSCTSWPRVPLPFGPVRSITEVRVDGVVLDSSKYQVDGPWLRRIDGENWPACQDMSKVLTEVGTWGWIYKHGIDIPPEAKPLIADYACELTRRCKGDDGCALPNGYKVARSNNVDYIVIDPMDYRLKLLTGYVPLDDWISAIMGGHARTQPRMAGRRRAGRVVPA